jgi:membrane protein insertase Oxa1/YidC/SpoIIIJ
LSNLYTKLNDILENTAIIISENYGMGIAILAITCGIKLIYAPIMVKCNINMLKLKLLDPETQLF